MWQNLLSLISSFLQLRFKSLTLIYPHSHCFFSSLNEDLEEVCTDQLNGNNAGKGGGRLLICLVNVSISRLRGLEKAVRIGDLLGSASGYVLQILATFTSCSHVCQLDIIYPSAVKTISLKYSVGKVWTVD